MPRTVSNPDPTVSNVADPDEGAVHLYQTEPVEVLRALGITSEVSKVAPVLLPVLFPDVPEIVMGEEKLSFATVILADLC